MRNIGTNQNAYKFNNVNELVKNATMYENKMLTNLCDGFNRKYRILEEKQKHKNQSYHNRSKQLNQANKQKKEKKAH